MQKHNTFLRSFVVVSVLLLSACSAHLNVEWPSDPILASDNETDDLAYVTADSLAMAEKAGKENILVVFDIDNTIMAMEQGLGADQWYDWQKDLSIHDKCNAQNTGNRFAAQGALFFTSAMRPTQEDAARQIRNIQEAGISVIALTSRGPVYRLQTFRELRRNGYSFTHSAIGPAGGYDATFIPVENGRLSRYEDGVFMTSGQHKGQMLHALLKKTGTAMPAVIVMADDKQKNLDAVKETFSALDIPVRAWRYTGEDNNVANFDPLLADNQWKSIEVPLRQIQAVMGPDNYDLSSVVLPAECQR